MKVAPWILTLAWLLFLAEMGQQLQAQVFPRLYAARHGCAGGVAVGYAVQAGGCAGMAGGCQGYAAPGYFAPYSVPYSAWSTPAVTYYQPQPSPTYALPWVPPVADYGYSGASPGMPAMYQPSYQYQPQYQGAVNCSPRGSN